MWKHIDLPIAYSVIWNKVVYHYFSYSQNSNFYMPSSVFEQRKNSKLYYETNNKGKSGRVRNTKKALKNAYAILIPWV